MRFRQGIGIALLTGSFASIIFGIIRHSPFAPHLWSSAVMLALGVYGIILIASFFGLRWVSRKFSLSLPHLLSAALVLGGVLLYGIVPALSLAVFFTASMAAGRGLLSLTKSEQETGTLLPLLLGMALLSLFFCWLSPLPVNTRGVHLGVIGSLLLADAVTRKFSWLGIKNSFHARGSWEFRDELVLCGLFLAASLVLLVGATPEIGYDGLAMHLYIPSYMQSHARWSYDPMRYAFSFMPASADFLFAHFFLFGGEATVRLFHVVTVLISLVPICRLIGFGSRTSILLAALLFLALPVTLLLSVHLFAEATLGLWLAGAAYALFGAGPVKARWFTLLACLAAACATKLHGVVFLPFGLAAGVYFLRPSFRNVLAGCPLLLLGSFPYWYSWIQTGNPVYPFYNDLFRAPYFPIIRFVDNRWIEHLHWSFLYDLTFKSPLFLESSNGVLGLTWLALLPLGLWAACSHRHRIALALIAIAAILVSSQTVQYIRYLYPFSLLLVPSLALALEEAERLAGKKLLFSQVGALLVASVWLWPTGFDPNTIAPSQLFSRGATNTMIRNLAPTRLANEFINGLGEPDPNVLYPDDPEGALLRGTAIYVNWYSHRLNWFARFAQDDETIAKFFEIAEVDYVVQPKAPLTPLSRALGEYFSRTAKPLAEFGRLSVYRVTKNRFFK